MEKYQIQGTQISFRVNNEERTELNQIANDLQTENNVVFNNAKELTFAIIDKMKQGNTEAPRQEAEVVEVLPAPLAEKFAVIKASIFENEDLTELQMLETLISIVNTPAPAVEIEKEKALAKNQILLTISTDKMGTIEQKLTLLDEISKRRANKFRMDQEPLDQLCEKLIFNDGTIFNIAGEFYTGF